MSYQGQTFQIPFERGGFDHNKNIDTIDATSMVDGSKNINFHKGAREKRGGTAKYHTSPLGARVLLDTWTVNAAEKALTYQISTTYESACYITFIVASKSTETDYIFIIGTNSAGTGQTEALDVSAGNGTYITSKQFKTITAIYCSDSAAGEGTVWADGTVKVTQPYGSIDITGLYNFTMQDGSNFLVASGSDGNIWYSDLSGTATFTMIDSGLASSANYSFEQLDDVLYIAIEGSTPRMWSGSGASTAMTDIPSSWTGTVFPKQFVVHGYGAAVALWAFGFADGTVYCSKDSDGTDFSDAEVLTMPIYTTDGYGIVGGFEYGDRLFAVGRNQVYIIDDTDSSRSNWGYQAAQWKGGAAHHRVIVRIPNDVVMMSPDGEIYSVVAAENYGDYKAASLARPAHIDNWIRQNLNLLYINKFHGCYDPILRAIKFFVVRSGQTECDTALVYFIDRDPKEAWAIHDNQENASGYSACSSCLVSQTVGEYEIFTGDFNGFIWKLEQSTKSDDSAAYLGAIKTPIMHFGDPRVYKHYHALRIIMQPQGTYDLNVNWWVDDVQQTSGTISQAASGVALGSFTLDTDVLGGVTLQDSSMQLGTIGKRIQFRIYDNTAAQDFFISQLLIDFKPLGGRDN